MGTSARAALGMGPHERPCRMRPCGVALSAADSAEYGAGARGLRSASGAGSTRMPWSSGWSKRVTSSALRHSAALGSLLATPGGAGPREVCLSVAVADFLGLLKTGNHKGAGLGGGHTSSLFPARRLLSEHSILSRGTGGGFEETQRRLEAKLAASSR